MTTLVVRLPPGLAKRLTTAAEIIGMTNEKAAIEAVRLFTRSIAPMKMKARKRATS